ncbi:MAG: DUF1415 domain-containing protein [Saprospiraceae bacterium]|nr:DUF1415 domain-containing protein [Saprospiraceae bacterium]
MLDKYKIGEEVKRWLDTVVIGLNLCPFAKREEVRGRVRYAVTEADNEEQLLLDLHAELELALRDIKIETTLLIHPNVLQEFYTYNDFLVLTDALLEKMDLVGVFQVASFHPDYQFAGTLPDDVENYTNRSPYPMLHILREASLSLAIDSHPDISNIPEQNMRLMREIGPEKMKILLRNCFLS